MDDNTILCMLFVAMYAVWQLCRVARGVEALDAALIAGEWSWEGIPARRSAYDSSFGGLLSRYDMLAAIKAEPGI